MSTSLLLVAPLEGWSGPLEEAPDPVFAGRMLGDGVAIDPTGNCLHAPCDGTLTLVPSSKHAVTLRTISGVEILLHVGIDTVGLGGEGFELHVHQGQEVRAGEKLISFDLDLLARRAKSVLTPVILTEGAFSVGRRAVGRLKVGDFLMEIMPASAPETAQSADRPNEAPQLLSRAVTVTLEHGIHARPAAQMAAALKGLVAEVRMVVAGRRVNARSPVALMGLGIQKNQGVGIEASGVDAAAAISALTRLLHGGAFAEASVAHGDSRQVRSAGPAPARAGAAVPNLAIASNSSMSGVIASRGLAVGRALRLRHLEIAVPELGSGAQNEYAALERARAEVHAALLRTAQSTKDAAAEVAAAHLEMIDDPELLATALSLIDEGKSAGYAWRTALRQAIDMLRSLSDPRMAERADDLLDLESRVLARLSGGASESQSLPPDTIVLADELLPSQLVALEAAQLRGICLAGGGPTSHVAIIAAALDIPTLVAIGPQLLGIPDGTQLVLDADGGSLHIAPLPSQLQAAREQLARRRERRALELAAAQNAGRTADGRRIEIFANIGSLAEAQLAQRNGAEGCGLLRTEFLFLERQLPPDEAEQIARYQEIAGELAGKPVTLRTLDIGGDKPIPYLPLPQEENPALGLRGIRTSLWRPDLLRTQLRAMLQVRPFGQCRILLPMITDPGEIRTVRHMIEELCQQLGRQQSIALGAMIETPASAVMAGRIAREVDFLSIGTNDLTQ